MTPKTGQKKGSNPPPTEYKEITPIAEFVNSLPVEHQEDVLAIVRQANLSIDIKLEYLEDHLTVGQLKICGRLLQEECSNFRQHFTSVQLKLVDKMLLKKDFSSIRKLLLDSPAALKAFQTYLKYNGHNEEADNKEEKVEDEKDGKENSKPDQKTKNHDRKRKESSEAEEVDDEEEADDEDVEESGEASEEEGPAHEENNKKKEPKDAPGNGSYKEWRRQNGEPKGIPTAAQIWELALKSGTEIAALTSKLHAVEKEKAALEKQLQEIERMHKRETDELNRKHEQKLQEAAQNHTDELTKQKQKHQKELKATRQFAAGRSSTENSDDDVEEESRYL